MTKAVGAVHVRGLFSIDDAMVRWSGGSVITPRLPVFDPRPRCEPAPAQRVSFSQRDAWELISSQFPSGYVPVGERQAIAPLTRRLVRRGKLSSVPMEPLLRRLFTTTDQVTPESLRFERVEGDPLSGPLRSNPPLTGVERRAASVLYAALFVPERALVAEPCAPVSTSLARFPSVSVELESRTQVVSLADGERLIGRRTHAVVVKALPGLRVDFAFGDAASLDHHAWCDADGRAVFRRPVDIERLVARLFDGDEFLGAFTVVVPADEEKTLYFAFATATDNTLSANCASSMSTPNDPFASTTTIAPVFTS